MNTILIGIAGGTGSGKTTLTRHLKEHFGKDVTVIGHDSYYKRQVGRTYEERAKVNYDHPNAFDTDLLIRHLQELKAGRSIQCPVYSFVEHNRTDQTVEIQPAKVIIVEGILIFQNPTLRDMFDIKIFVETDADERILRRALRDVEERGRTLQSVVSQYLTTVKPMHEQYVEPSRKYADIVVLEGGHNLVALDMIMQRIQHHIDGKGYFSVEGTGAPVADSVNGGANLPLHHQNPRGVSYRALSQNRLGYGVAHAIAKITQIDADGKGNALPGAVNDFRKP